MTRGQEDSALLGACVSRDARRACLRATDGETEAQGGGHKRSQSADREAGPGGVQDLRLQPPVPSVPAAKVLEAQGSPRQALRWGSRHLGALPRDRRWGRALGTAPPPGVGSVIKIPGLGFWRPVLAVLDCMVIALRTGPDGPQDVKRQHRDECSP